MKTQCKYEPKNSFHSHSFTLAQELCFDLESDDHLEWLTIEKFHSSQKIPENMYLSENILFSP